MWRLVTRALSGWSEDSAPRLGAALAYYTVFSIAPLLVIAVGVAGVVFGPDAARGQIVGQIAGLVGEQGAQAIEEMIEHAGRQRGAGLGASLIGLATLLFGASGVFGELQSSMNAIWGVKPRPGRGLLGMLRDRFASFTMVLGIAFVLLVSLVVSAALAALGRVLGAGEEGALHVLNLAVSFGVVTLLFAATFKYVPDIEIEWRDVWIGAAVTALLFTVGKLAIGLYLGKAGVASAYGAAGSLVVVLVWVYYSAQILFLGAEFTKAYAQTYGSGVRTEPDAVPVERATDAGGDRRGAPDRRRAADQRAPIPVLLSVAVLLGYELGRTPARRLVEQTPKAVSTAGEVGRALLALDRFRSRRRDRAA
jgi:membrane protein